MEKLPIEVVEQIAEHLTPQDLAHLCAASSCYREIFNQDIFWKPHCSLELEEALRTTPCLVEPKFVVPESEDSTLSPLSQWRLAFLRENHLWKNWRTDKYKEVDLPDVIGEDLIEFLTPNLIVTVNRNHIEIWDVSVWPVTPSLVMKKYFCSSYVKNKWLLVRTDMLVFIANPFVIVFNIDIINNCIDLKHMIELEYCPSFNVPWGHRCAFKDTTLIHISRNGSVLRVYDLDSGVKLKEEDCPTVTDGNERAKINGLLSSKTCDNVVVSVGVVDASSIFRCFNIYIYSLSQLTFLSFVTNVAEFLDFHIAVHGHHLALAVEGKLKVHNYNTSEVLFEETVSSILNYQLIEVLNNRIVFISLGESPSFHYCLNIFSCADKQSSQEKVLVEGIAGFPFMSVTSKVINDKFLTLHESYSNTHYAWEPSSKLFRNYKIPWWAMSPKATVNEVWTVAIGSKSRYNHLALCHYW